MPLVVLVVVLFRFGRRVRTILFSFLLPARKSQPTSYRCCFRWLCLEKNLTNRLIKRIGWLYPALYGGGGGGREDKAAVRYVFVCV